MKNLLIGLIVGSVISGMWVQYHFTGNVWSNKPKQDLIKIEDVESSYLKQYLKQSKKRCYFTSTYGDVTREEELDCDYYDKYYNANFNTIHVDSLPHGYIK